MEYQLLTKLQKIDAQPERQNQIEIVRAYLAQKGWLGTLDQRNRAIELERSGAFADAVEQWKALISSIEPQIRQEALSRAGTCLLKAGKENEKEAAALFERHLQEAKTQPGHPRDLIVSVYHLAQLRDPKSAGKAVEQFLRDNPTLDLGARLGLAVHALDAYVRAGDLRSAQTVLEYIRENRADRQEEYARALGLLAWGYDTQSEDASSKNPLSEDYFNNAVQLYTQSLNSVSQPVLKFEAALSIAGRTYERAKVKGDKDPSLYSRARTLFEHVKTRYPDQVKNELGMQIEWHIGLCYLNEKNFDSALEVIRRVSRQCEPSVAFDEAIGDCWFGKAMQAEGKERINHLNQANIVYNEIINAYVKSKKREEGYFRNLCKRFDVLFHLDRVELRNTIEFYRMKGIGGKWDENKWGYQTKIREIEKRLAEVDPNFRVSPE
jgi:tetratricopeptide (TPR) repeat protein